MSSVECETVRVVVTDPPQKRKRPGRAGVIVSLIFHTTAIVALIVVPYLLWLWMWSKALAKEQPVTIIAQVEEVQPQEPAPPPVRVVTDVSQVTAVPVQEKLQKHIDESNRRPDDEDRDEFEKHARRLEEISDEKSVVAMAGQLRKWLGTKKRASRPLQQPAAGPFDHDTEQIHDIRREKQEDGSWKYIVVLVDAEGRSMETELEGADAADYYRTFQRLKQFPLAEQVYRETVMPLLDKMLPDRRSARR